MNKKVISRFNNLDDFMNVLKNNPGIFIVKFGAKWCEPCNRIKTVVDAVFSTTPDTVVCADLDISESAGNKEIYNLLKRRRMIDGIPAMFMYKQGNTDIVPDESFSGTNSQSMHLFFTRCGRHLQSKTKNITA